MRLALFLTLSRVILAPCIVLLNLYPAFFGLSQKELFWVMLVVLIYAELSDIFDGIIARRLNQVTNLGKLLDPMSDSIFRMSVFFSFAFSGPHLPLLWVLSLFYRDCLVSLLRNLCALKGLALAARVSGKIKAIVQAVASFLIVIAMGLKSYGVIKQETLHNFSTVVIALCAIYALSSGFEYFWAHRKTVLDSLKKL